MNKKFLLITGGTGGHVIPAVNFANYLINKDINCKIILDKRGAKYIDYFNGKTFIVKSSNLHGSIIKKIYGLASLTFGFFQSMIMAKPRFSYRVFWYFCLSFYTR